MRAVALAVAFVLFGSLAWADSGDWELRIEGEPIPTCVKTAADCVVALDAIERGLLPGVAPRTPAACIAHPNCFTDASNCIAGYNCR